MQSTPPKLKRAAQFSRKSKPTSVHTSSDSNGVMSLHKSDDSKESFTEMSEDENVQNNEGKRMGW